MGSNLTKNLLTFDPANPNNEDNVGSYLRASDGTLITHTTNGAVEALDVNVANTVTVSATNLDIRDLVFSTDKVDVSGSTVALDSTTLAALESITVQNGAGASAVNIQDGGNSITVDATALDIRALAFSTDKVDVSNSTVELGSTTLAALESITVQNGAGASAVNIQDGGNSITVDGTVTATVDISHAEDAAHVSGDKGAFVLAVRNDAGTTMVNADGDYAPLQVDANGALRVSGSFSVNPADNHAEDSAAANGDIGSFILGVRQDTLATSTSADGDYNAIKTNARGAVWTAPVGTVADDVADTEAPVKVGTRSVSGAALSAVTSNNNRADVISDKYRRIYINDSPNIAIATSAKSITTTAAAVVTTALAGRRRIQIQNGNSADIYIGDSSVTSSTGLLVPKNATESLDIGDNVAIYAITASGTASIRVLELA